MKPYVVNYPVRPSSSHNIDSIDIGITGFAQAIRGNMDEYDEKQKFAFKYEYKYLNSFKTESDAYDYVVKKETETENEVIYQTKNLIK
jgi:hypothetical protein